MNYSEVIDLLKSKQNEQGVKKWNNSNSAASNLKSFGIGLTILRKLAKQIGRDHDLAQELWKSDFYDAKIIALLIDDPKQITRLQAEMQVENVNHGHLAHVFCSCGAALAKTPFVVDLMVDWMNSKDTIRRYCGYGLLYELSKSKKKTTPDDRFFLEWIERIRISFFNEHRMVQVSMGGALLGIGKRNAILNVAALKVARIIGPIQIESDSSKCDPFDVVKHLTSDYIRQKLGL